MYPNVRINPHEGEEVRFRTPMQLLNFLKYVKYVEFGQLMHPEEVIESGYGSCHDQALLMIYALSPMKRNPKGKFLIAIDDNNKGNETHTFVYFTLEDKFYWIENTWEDYKGMKAFDSEQELIDYVITAFAERNPNQTIMLCDFVPEDHKIGEDLLTYVDICTRYMRKQLKG